MTLEASSKQKRNRPCENCRAHRRKCFVSQGMQCERCCRMELPCVFKFTAKPNIVKKFVPMSKRNRMLDQVQFLEEEVAAMEMQLRSLHVAAQLRQQRSNNRDEHGRSEKKRAKRNSWQLTLSRDDNGLQLQTSIKSVADVAAFLRNTIGYFTPYRSPNYFVDRRQQYLVVTNKMLNMEHLFRIIFAKKMDHGMMLEFPRLYHQQQHHYNDTMAAKLHFLDTYFRCNGFTIPILVQPYYHAYLRNNPSNMLASAIAAFVGHAQCQHVRPEFQPNRREMAEMFRQEARALVEDAMFDDEPNVEVVGTLLMLAQTYLILLRNSEGRIYISMAWRIAMQLRDLYLPVLQRQEVSGCEVDLAEAESWRRMFYMVRYLEINMHIVYDARDSVSPTLLHDDIGYPIVLPCEAADPNLSEAVHLYRHVVRINDCHISTRVDETGYRLMLGSMDEVPSSDIEYLESQMFGFWRGLPAEYHLSDGPMEYLSTERVQRCQNPNVLYLNKLYYCYWLALETRLMQPPARTDLVGASLNRVDGERALVIVSICCDALAKIFQELNCRLPCVLELHWVLIACDAMKQLRESRNAHIRMRAEDNLRTALKILKNNVLSMNGSSDLDSYPSMDNSQQPMSLPRHDRNPTPFSTSSGSTVATSDDECDIISPSTSSSTVDAAATGTAAYFFELKRTLESYFTAHDYSIL